MIETSDLEKKVWWGYLGHDLQELLNESNFLFKKARDITAHDYSFVVFPAAKAYEGFLKKMFLDLGFITEEDYFGKHFRIGKALNPSLPKEVMKDGVYNKIAKYCGGETLANTLWEAWRESRNLTFHWFPNEKNAITLEEANERIEQIINAIDQAFVDCRII